MNRWWRRLGVVLAACAGLVALGSTGTAAAHPLGNFTVNHYDGLRLFADRVELFAVVDYAEIPTLQQFPLLDADADGTVGPAEAAARAAAECAGVAAGVAVAVDGETLTWAVQRAELSTPPGEAGLATTRVECRLSGPAALADRATVEITDRYLADRIGWREITAVGEGVRLAASPLPVATVSAELRAYPNDLLTDPLEVRSATLEVEPGSGGGGTGAVLPTVSAVDGLLGTLDGWFTGLVGRDDLTAEVGLLAVLLAVVLGASHAMLPGHGKTVMAAYLAGRRGTRRDALLVGATVTATHTAGVLVLGLLLTVATTLAPDGVLSWLGVASGLLVAGIGVGLLISAVRGRRSAAPEAGRRELVPVGHGPGVAHDHSQTPGRGDDGHGQGEIAAPAPDHNDGHGHGHGLFGHGHGHGHGHGDAQGKRFGRAALVGLGVAGGLVPSPTALLVLLGAIGLGRTWFGVGLVLSYGLGMAATLTAAGLLLVGLRDRLDRARLADRLRSRTASFMTLTPLLTSLLVLVVGLGLAARSLSGVV